MQYQMGTEILYQSDVGETMGCPVSTEIGILSLIREQEEQIRSFGVKLLGLFGSFVRGQQNESSDVDLLVEFETGRKTFDSFIRLAFLPEDLLERRPYTSRRGRPTLAGPFKARKRWTPGPKLFVIVAFA